MTPPELDVLLLRDAAQEGLVEAVPEGERHEPCGDNHIMLLLLPPPLLLPLLLLLLLLWLYYIIISISIIILGGTGTRAIPNPAFVRVNGWVLCGKY